jgi:hypothetical protein
MFLLKNVLTSLVLAQLSFASPGRYPSTYHHGNETGHDKLGAVASESSICSDIGIDVLKEGGNAADSLIATTFCVGVIGMVRSPTPAMQVITDSCSIILVSQVAVLCLYGVAMAHTSTSTSERLLPQQLSRTCMSTTRTAAFTLALRAACRASFAVWNVFTRDMLRSLGSPWSCLLSRWLVMASLSRQIWSVIWLRRLQVSKTSWSKILRGPLTLHQMARYLVLVIPSPDAAMPILWSRLRREVSCSQLIWLNID